MEAMTHVLRDVYANVLRNAESATGAVIGGKSLVSTSETEYIESLEQFLVDCAVVQGKLRGRTVLPLPSNMDTLVTDDGKRTKEKTHQLEAVVIVWIRQIKGALLVDRIKEGAAANGFDMQGPRDEIKFWEDRKHDLQSIWNQLQNGDIKTIVRILESGKSSITKDMRSLVREVVDALEEARSNHRYLEVLQPFIDKILAVGESLTGEDGEGTQSLTSESLEAFMGLEPLWKPLMHTIWLIWKNSPYYRQPDLLSGLLKKFCNEIIRQASKAFKGKQITTFASPTASSQALEFIHQILRVCVSFKNVFFDYKR